MSAATERLEQLRARRIEVSKQWTEREAELERSREHLARAIAERRPTDPLQTRVRTLAEEVEGLERAIPLLEREIKVAEEEHRQALILEADQEADRLAREAEETVAALDGALRVAAEQILELAAKAEDLSRRSRRADVRAARLADRRPPVVGRAAWAWQARPLLVECIRYLRGYQAGGFHAAQRKERERREAMAGQAS